MLKEFLQEIQLLTKQAAGPKIVMPPGGPADHFLIFNPYDGSLQKSEMPPHPLAHRVNSLSALANAVKEIHKDDGGKREVWYSRAGIYGLLSPNGRDRAFMPLTHSPQIETLLKLERKTPMTQADTIFMLRTTFRDSSGNDNFLPALRVMRWTVAADGATSIKHGQQSVGKKIEAQITGHEAIPEYFGFYVPIFREAECRWPGLVNCAVELDAHTQTITIMPIPGSIEEAFQDAEGRIRGELEGHFKTDDVSVFYGVPSPYLGS